MPKTSPIPRSVDNSASYFAEIQDTWLKEKEESDTMLYDSAMVDGHPPLTEKNSELGMWQSLQLMRATGDPRFDAEAQAMYAKLAAKFGNFHPPSPQVPGFILPVIR